MTVENGTVAGYRDDIEFEYTTGSRIEHVHAGMGATDEYIGIDYAYSTKGEINHSSVEVTRAARDRQLPPREVLALSM